MSNPVYVGCWFPSELAIEENGARRLMYAFEATNEKLARAKAVFLFAEQFPEADDTQFDLRIYLDRPGLSRPALNRWDEKMLYQHDWDEANGCMGSPIQTQAPTKVEFDKLSSLVRICVLVKYHSTEINSDQLHAAITLSQLDANTFDSHIVEAITKTPSVAAMYPERILEAIDYIRETFTANSKWPELKNELAEWVNQRTREVKEPTDTIAPPVAVVRPYEHSYKTLDIEIAVALWPGDVDPNAPQPSITRWANDIIKDDREDFKRWSIQLSTQPNILKYDRPTIYGVVRNAPASDTYRFPESHNRYITGYLSTHGRLEHSAVEIPLVIAEKSEGTPAMAERVGPFYYRTAEGSVVRANKVERLQAAVAQGSTEISKEQYQQMKEAPPAEPQNITEQPAIETVDDEPCSSTEQEINPPQIATQPEAPVFQSIAAALEKDLAEKGDNLKIWRSVMRTDPRYTKDLAGMGFEGTSINAEYMIMRATEIFGPIGRGWGFEVLEDRMIPGAPMSEAIYENNKFIGNRMLRDGNGTLITELNHSIKIAFWYLTETGAAERFEAFGATPYMYKTKSGIRCDGEVQKKSLTDAIKKALSLLGFSADIWLGLYDQAEYKEENKIEFDIRNASDKAEDVTRIRKELDEKFKLNTDSMRSAVTPNEISGIASSLTRVMGVHLKAAREKTDAEYTKYLEGRLRRIEEVKAECLAKLQEKAA